MSDYNADPDPDLNKCRVCAFCYKLAPLTDLKVDQFSTPTDLKVYHFVRKLGSTRMQFLVDPELIPT